MRSIYDLVPKLIEATQLGKVQWDKELGALFSTQIGNTKITTWEWDESEDQTSGVSISMDKDGHRIDFIRASQYSPYYKDLIKAFSPWFRLPQMLWLMTCPLVC